MKSSHSRAFSKSLAFLTTLLLCFVWTMAASAQNTINTIAGGGSVNGPATGPMADIAGPSSVAQDAKGNTYITAPSQNQIFKVDTSGNLTVFAGIGYPTEDPQKLDGGPATSGSLNNPVGIATDAKGNVYIADTTDYLIREVYIKAGTNTYVINNLAGNAHQCASPMAPPPACGDGGAPYNATLGAPTAVAVDKAGNLYIADTNDNRIRVVNRTGSTITIANVQILAGTINTIAGTGYTCSSPTSPCGDGGQALAATMNGPNGIALDSNGNIYFSDTGDRRIRVISTSTGIVTGYAGNGTACAPAKGCGNGGAAINANISAPWQISFDSSNNLYITEPPVNDIREVTWSSGTIQTVAGNYSLRGYSGDGGAATSAGLNGPRGVWASPGGGFIIGDSGDQVVRAVNATTGFITTLAGGNGTTVASGGDGGPATSAILAGNRATAVDSLGNVYIADTANNRIRKISGCSGTAGTGFCTSNITTFAGTGIANYTGDGGPATSATLSGPDGVGVDASGNVYIADSNNFVVREVNPSTGIITTIAGNGKSCAPSCGDGGLATKASLAFPTTVEVDTAGNIYIADQRANQVRIVYPGGIIGTFAGGTTSIACMNTGNYGSAASAELNGPFSVAPDLFGNVYIANTNENQVEIVNSGIMYPYAFDCNGILFGPEKGPALDAAYQTPQDVVIDPHGNMYVAGSGLYYVIQRVDYSDPTHEVIGVSGKTGDPKYYGFLGDGGLALGAELDNYGASVDGGGHLYVADGVNNRVREILLTPTSNLAPSSLKFPPQPLNVTSPVMYFKITNTGSDDLYISSIAVTGDFALTQATPCLNSQVEPQGSCTIGVTFTPTVYGVRTGTVVISDNAYQDPTQTVYLTGYGPDFSISAVPSSLTVTHGNQGTSTITLTPSAGFNQTVNLSCTGQPPMSTCKIVPNSWTLDGTDPESSTLTLSTNANTPTGSYTLKAKGTSVTTHTVNIALTIQ
ncbi:MAG: choice-of-anchor D domain-containing protein [Terriglobales bacterium]|jgi:trimeric autotransporter adhesin